MKPIQTILVVLFAAFVPGCGVQVETSMSDGAACQVPLFTRAATLDAASQDHPSSFFGGQCLPVEPVIDVSGNVACFVLDLRSTGGVCACDSEQGFVPVAPEHVSAARSAGLGATADCACEVQPIAGEPQDVAACENEVAISVAGADGQPLNGWCYVDPGLTPPRGSADLAAPCPSNERRLIRLVGVAGVPAAVERTMVFVCQTGPAPACAD